jgi:hypothetical protein
MRSSGLVDLSTISNGSTCSQMGKKASIWKSSMSILMRSDQPHVVNIKPMLREC